MEERTWRPIILEIPVSGFLPPMWDTNEKKQIFLKWLDDKPCIYHTIGINKEYIFVINSPDYIIREWLQKFYIPMTNTELTVDELIEEFENKGLSELCEENLNKIISEAKKRK